MTSKAGGSYSVQDYTPWGTPRSGNLTETTLDYTGQRKDDTGLLFYNVRYYDPALGRLVSPDTIGPQHGNPQARNRYSYALNNPLKFTDPTGYCSENETDDAHSREENSRCTYAQEQLLEFGVKLLGLSDWMAWELELVLEALNDFITAADWSRADFTRAVGPTWLQRVQGKGPDGYAGEQNMSSIYLYDGAFDPAYREGDKRVIVHEFAHRWDAHSQSKLSSGLVTATGGTQHGACWFEGFAGGYCTGAYDPGQDYTVPRPKESHFVDNKYEDFAESVAASIYGPIGNPSYPGSVRDKYVYAKFREYGRHP